MRMPRILPLTTSLGDARPLAEIPAPPMPASAWYAADTVGAGFEVRFPAGTLAGCAYLTLDVTVDGANSVVFCLRLHAGDDGPSFTHTCFFLNGVVARIRLPLAATNQNRWLLEREAAWLKPMVGGDRVDPARVDRLAFTILRKSAETARFCLSPVRLHAAEPPRLVAPPLLHGPLFDAFGQSATRTWPGKVYSEEQLVAHLRERRRDTATAAWPEGFTRWGGCRDLCFPATGFFRVARDATRCWLVAPDGAAFWSAGIDCLSAGNFATPVGGLRHAFAWLPPNAGATAPAWRGRRGVRSDSVCFHTTNLIRAFGDEWHAAWEELAGADFRRIGFNTVGNWSDWRFARARGLPYVRPLDLSFRRTAPVFRDFPDVCDTEALEADCADLAAQLAVTRDDPALIGFFLGNEPTWGFAAQTPAEGMLANAPRCRTRAALAEWLRARHGGDAALAAAWRMPAAALSRIVEGLWTEPFTPAAQADLAAFSTVMVARLFDTASRACRTVDPHHLNLGARYYTVPPAWALAGMTSFDVFSINCYRPAVPAELVANLAAATGKPVLIGEWHFGALDVGLPSSGIGHVPTQADRGRAYRHYLEGAAAQPWCVGAHYFTFYDQSAAGRFDGENYNIGFFDVCNQPYAPLVAAARTTHATLYDVARGLRPPTTDTPPHLPMLFC